MTSENFDALNLENIANHPFCKHGPSILFANEKKKFYACSACRDGKVCKFYVDYNEVTETKSKEWHQRYTDQTLKKLEVYKENFKKVRDLQADQRFYCNDCHTFIFDSIKKHIHFNKKHTILKDISDDMLKKPIRTILEPKIKNSANAQFLFDDTTFEVILKTIKKFSYDSVLCIGTPSVFERLQDLEPTKSMLMDIDQRFTQFYENDSFLPYNMFNNHFFDNKQSYTNFLAQSKKLLVIIDPPYGGIVKLVANTINQIKADCDEHTEMSTLLFYPYFMETWVKNWLPSYKMIDFKVCYENQRKFSKDSTGKGSTARIFTDISPDQIELPIDIGYHYCKLCKKYTFKENTHCKKCNGCTSKDGGHYKHCDQCERCVKITYDHCEKCEKCHLKDLKDCSSRTRSNEIIGALKRKNFDVPYSGSLDNKKHRK